MKRLSFLTALILTVAVVALSGCKSKSGTWKKQNKDEWTSNCMKFMTERGVSQANAADFCDCMLKKTSNQYTPEEAQKITPEEERKLWKECDYSW